MLSSIPQLSNVSKPLAASREFHFRVHGRNTDAKASASANVSSCLKCVVAEKNFFLQDFFVGLLYFLYLTSSAKLPMICQECLLSFMPISCPEWC